MRNSGHYLLLFLKGAAMGAADVVPGVSGGTIAFVSGIYVELIDTIKSINIKALKVLRSEGVAAAWAHINGKFLVTLLAGILHQPVFSGQGNAVFTGGPPTSSVVLLYRLDSGLRDLPNASAPTDANG